MAILQSELDDGTEEYLGLVTGLLVGLGVRQAALGNARDAVLLAMWLGVERGMTPEAAELPGVYQDATNPARARLQNWCVVLSETWLEREGYGPPRAVRSARSKETARALLAQVGGLMGPERVALRKRAGLLSEQLR